MSKSIKLHVGSKIARARKIKFLSQEDIALKISVSRNTISRWEKGQVQSSLFIQKLPELCYQLDLDFTEVIKLMR